MDLKNLDYRAAQSNGAFLHLRHPATGDLMWEGAEVEGNEVGVYVKGVEDPKAQRLARIIQADNFKNDRERENAGLDYAYHLVCGFKNLTRDGELLDHQDPKDLKAFFDLTDDFVHQIMEFAQVRANFSVPE